MIYTVSYQHPYTRKWEKVISTAFLSDALWKLEQYARDGKTVKLTSC